MLAACHSKIDLLSALNCPIETESSSPKNKVDIHTKKWLSGEAVIEESRKHHFILLSCPGMSQLRTPSGLHMQPKGTGSPGHATPRVPSLLTGMGRGHASSTI